MRLPVPPRPPRAASQSQTPPGGAAYITRLRPRTIAMGNRKLTASAAWRRARPPRGRVHRAAPVPRETMRFSDRFVSRRSVVCGAVAAIAAAPLRTIAQPDGFRVIRARSGAVKLRGADSGRRRSGALTERFRGRSCGSNAAKSSGSGWSTSCSPTDRSLARRARAKRDGRRARADADGGRARRQLRLSLHAAGRRNVLVSHAPRPSPKIARSTGS